MTWLRQKKFSTTRLKPKTTLSRLMSTTDRTATTPMTPSQPSPPSRIKSPTTSCDANSSPSMRLVLKLLMSLLRKYRQSARKTLPHVPTKSPTIRWLAPPRKNSYRFRKVSTRLGRQRLTRLELSQSLPTTQRFKLLTNLSGMPSWLNWMLT